MDEMKSLIGSSFICIKDLDDRVKVSSRSQFSLFFSTLLYFSNSFSFVQVQLSHVHSSSSKRMNKKHHWYWEADLEYLILWSPSKGTVVLGRCGPYPTTTRRRRLKGLSVPTPQQQLSNYWRTPRRGPTQRTDGTPRCSETTRPPSPPTSPPSTTRRPPSSASTAPAPA